MKNIINSFLLLLHFRSVTNKFADPYYYVHNANIVSISKDNNKYYPVDYNEASMLVCDQPPIAFNNLIVIKRYRINNWMLMLLMSKFNL